MSDNSKILQSIIPAKCPHCAQDILISYQMMPPQLSSVFKPEEVVLAKDMLKKKLEEIKFKSPEEKAEVLRWLEDENTLISTGDVDPVLQQIIIDQEGK